MRFGMGLAVLLACVTGVWGAAPPAKWRGLTADEEREVAALEARLVRPPAEFEQAARVAEQVAEYRRARQGSAHWEAVNARFRAEELRRLAAVPKKDRPEVARAIKLDDEGETLLEGGRFREAEKPLKEALTIWEKALGPRHPRTASGYTNLASCLDEQGRHDEARPLYRKALRICEEVLGPDHPSTAAGYNNVAHNLDAQRRHAEALPLHRKALAANQKGLGAAHPTTASSYNNLAVCLIKQGRPAEALPLLRKSLAIYQKVLGPGHLATATVYNSAAGCLDDLGKGFEALPLYFKALAINEEALGTSHPTTATSYNNLALCLQRQGRAAEALPLFRKALAIRQKALGEAHPDTASSYASVASCLGKQGRHAEALPLFKRALAICEKALGPSHPSTAQDYNNLATCLHAQGKAAEALPLFRKALDIRKKALGPHHPSTASSYGNVAACLGTLDRYAEALPLFREALAIRQKALGENHPSTAASYGNLASCLDVMGNRAEALRLHRKAVRIKEKVLGQGHPDTAGSYNTLAMCLWEQGRRVEAVRIWQASQRGQEAARALRADSGFDRAQGGHDTASPRAALAVGLARLGQPRNAFAHAEASLARGLLDELGGLTPAEAVRVAELRGRLSKLEPALVTFSLGERLSAEEKERHEGVKREYGRLWEEWSGLLATASARAVLPLDRIQEAIPPDAALVLSVEELGERWACVLRLRGAPAWEKLAADPAQAARLYSSLTDPASDAGRRRQLLDALRKGWYDPLLPHLKGVKRLLVVPTGELARVPAELLVPEFTVSYVPSGTFLARVAEAHRPVAGTSLLALGDPAFDRAPPPEPPASGVMVLSVLPGSSAARAGLQAGDVILSVGSVPVESGADLEGALEQAPAAVAFWREGRRLKGRLPGAPLGASVDPRSARAAVRAWRRGQDAATQRGTGHKRLPGTRAEAGTVGALVKGSTLLLGSDASEQRLDEMIADGRLKKCRILHLATHGEADEQRPGNSSLILAQDRLPDPVAQVNAGRHPYDGRLTVGRILQRWELDADLVVLSACETGLGKQAKGDGLLGFAHAFLGKGARAVVLSRWKVDDSATSLLMVRFYENLLGKRKGGAKPMGRAAALAEAKRWLRELPRKEAERLATLHSGGVLRGSEADQKPPGKAKPVQLKGERPYAHPFYWAAFTLVGDPD